MYFWRKYNYTYFLESKIATLLSRLSTPFKETGIVCLLFAVFFFIADVKYFTYSFLGVGIFILILYLISKYFSATIDLKAIIKRLELDNDQVKEYIEKNKDSEEWFLKYHDKYKEINKEKVNKKNRRTKWKPENIQENTSKTVQGSLIRLVVLLICFAIASGIGILIQF